MHIIHFQSIEENARKNAAPKGVSKDTNKLNGQKLVVARVQKAFIDVEKTCGNNGPNTTETMDLRNVKRIVYLKPVSEFSCLGVDYGADNPDYGGWEKRYVGTWPSYADEAC